MNKIFLVIQRVLRMKYQIFKIKDIQIYHIIEDRKQIIYLLTQKIEKTKNMKLIVKLIRLIAYYYVK